MRSHRWIWLAASLVLAAAALIAFLQFRPQTPTGTELNAGLATPPGITLRAVPRTPREEALGAPATIQFADADGAPLYSLDPDPDAQPGTPLCAQDCAHGWQPALAPPHATAAGQWSVVPTPAGPQWVFGGRKLYRRAGAAAVQFAEADARGHSLTFDWRSSAALPVGIGLRDLPNAGGQAFVDDRDLTLYAYAGTDETSPCAKLPCGFWKPAFAPEIANPIGAFSVVARRDGIRQWAYRGRPLYRFAGDLVPDDVRGAGVDPRFEVALLLRYFMPGDVAIRHAPGLGDILVTRAGMTLYARDRFIDTDGHDFRTDHGAEATGRALGTGSCDVECEKTWRPLAAPPEALPSGYWAIFMRADGIRQWAYKGYALYTFAGDLKPGDVNGNESYALMPLGKEDPYTAVLAAALPAPRPGLGIGAMFWRVATP